MLKFLTGTGLSIALAVFVIGLLTRFVLYFLGLDWRLERIAYKPDMAHGLKGGLWSVLKWMIPMGTRGWKAQPLVSVATFLMHLGVVFVPLFLLGHNAILEQTVGISLPSLPRGLSHVLTILGIAGAGYMLYRRLTLPYVRILTTRQDYLLIGLACFLLVTGFLAAVGFAGYGFWLFLHVLAGDILLIIAPFTKLSHIVLFFASRIQIGMDFAIKRGGHEREGGALFPW
ncbi:respiratory nitrate reductase subunit gamma [Desulfovibrio sp. OttesenSCG-928-C14]|nr:respiratory nitrate reductase subunit gamma [Desulfovibrio sp. OttesenSCG-928-C14]